MFIYENEGTFTLIIIFSPITCQHVLLKKMERKNMTFINNMFSKTLLHPWIIHRWFRKSHFLKIQTLRKNVCVQLFGHLFSPKATRPLFVCFLFPLCMKMIKSWMSKMLNVSTKLHLSGASFQKVFFKKVCACFSIQKPRWLKPGWHIFPQSCFHSMLLSTRSLTADPNLTA